jgi:hypothetical protein
MMINLKGFIRKESWTNFKVLSRHSRGGTDENQENSQDIRWPGPKFEPGTYQIRSRTFSRKYGVAVRHFISTTDEWIYVRQFHAPVALPPLK